MALSGAVRTLQLEMKKIQEEPVEGFRVRLINDDNLFEWEVAIFGPPGTLYEAGYFKVDTPYTRLHILVYYYYYYYVDRDLDFQYDHHIQSLSDGGELSKIKVSFFPLIHSILHYKLQKWFWCIKNPIWHLFL